MNKKQLVVTWIIGIHVASVLILEHIAIPIYNNRITESGIDLSKLPDKPFWHHMVFTYLFPLYSHLKGLFVPVLIVGCLLIYTLKDKKK